MNCYVYAIGFQQDLLDQAYQNCYIGVTVNPEKRFKDHSKSGYTVCQYIQENHWTYENNMQILYTGNAEECYNLEEMYRPMPLIGLNEAAGGHGGHTSYSKERNAKISKALTGRKMSWGKKVSDTKKANGSSKGHKNSMAKTWKFVDPSGVCYVIVGNYQEFCEEQNISHAALRRVISTPLGEISPKFRDHGNENSRKKRINSTGWTLFEEN
jgi:hypothetical protein